jgi:hypothetical protein
MYRIDGGDQKGRNDSAKLGHITLEIYEHGHVSHYHRSYGATLTNGAAPPVALRPHVKTSNLTGIYVDMRHAWAEEMVVAPSGALDEFRRKRARNDYTLMALWEMGLRGLRVPIQDLQDARTRSRMEIMTDVGHFFHVYLYGLPNNHEVALLAEHRRFVAQLELVVNWDEIQGNVERLRFLSSATQLPIILSRVNRKDRAKHAGGRYNHLISHGFSLEEAGELAGFLGAHRGLVTGAQFTIPRSISPWRAGPELAAFAKETGARPFLYVKSTESSPAESFEDDTANALRFAEAVIAGVGHGVEVVLDTFDDADRGYFARTGLVDRRFNPRVAGEVISTLVNALGAETWGPAPGEGSALLNAKGQRLSVVVGPVSPQCEVLDPATGRATSAEQLKPRSISVVLTKP